MKRDKRDSLDVVKKMDTVSVIIPVYNVEGYIKKCVESVIEQTYKELEIILVDDGSVDESGMICDKFALEDSRIKVIHKRNGGLSSARNSGIDIATGDWITFIDSDDYVSIEYISQLLDKCIRNNTKVSVCGRYDVFPTRIEEKTLLADKSVFNAKEALREILVKTDIDVSAWGKIYKRELFAQIRYPEGDISEDVAVIFDIFTNAGTIAHTGTSLYYYVQRDDSITGAGFKVADRSALKNYKKLHDQVCNVYPDMEMEADAYLLRFVMSLLNSYYYKKILRTCTEGEEIFFEELHTLFKQMFRRMVANGYISGNEKLIGFLYLTRTYSIIKQMLVNMGLTHRLNR